MDLRFNFNEKKAIAVILYLAQSLVKESIDCDIHKLSKILYFADQKHIAKYGRPIVGDYYIAMEYGPVPSKIYDMLKIVRGDSIFQDMKGYNQYFDVKGYNISPKQEPDIDELAEAELDSIVESLQENKLLNFRQLVKKSHDAAYKHAAQDDSISFIEMAKVAKTDPSLIHYMEILAENERALA